MNVSDLINGLFELVGAFVIGLNVYRLYHDKQVKGVHWGSTFYFTAWGVWNLVFYPTNGLWFSLIGGIAIVAVQLVWLGLVFQYYRNRRLISRALPRNNMALRRRHDRKSAMWNPVLSENVSY